MRNTFIRTLEKIAASEDIFLLVGDLGYSVVENFSKNYPSKFLNVGVAEQNMAAIASGIASTSKRVFTYSIANFPTFRAAEQIRNLIDYHSYPVTTVSVGSGLSYGNLGYTHHGVTDLGLMKLFCNHYLYTPCDPDEVAFCVQDITKNSRPSYLRLGKTNEPNLSKQFRYSTYGDWIVRYLTPQRNSRLIIRIPNDSNILTRRVNDLHLYDQISIPRWSGTFEDEIFALLTEYEEIIVYENHQYNCGIYSTLKTVYPNMNNMRSLALNSDCLTSVGDEKYLNEKFLNFN